MKDQTLKFTIQREALLKPLQAIGGVVERRQTLPILSHVLLEVKAGRLSLTGTDLEVQIQGSTELKDNKASGGTTVPARKLMDICRTLPEQAEMEISIENQKVTIKSGRSRFSLLTLPAADFPNIEESSPGLLEFSLPQKELRFLIEKTSFAIAQQDARQYLRGMLLEAQKGVIRAVATDAHRLALSTVSTDVKTEPNQVIVPRKGIMELLRLLSDQEGEVSIVIGTHHLRVVASDYVFNCKLIEGRFPNYEKVIPKNSNNNIVVDRDILKQALQRAAILSNEKLRGVCIQLRPGLLRLLANNPEHEEAEEELVIDYQGEEIDIGFNIDYLLDVCNTLPAGAVKLSFLNAESGALIESLDAKDNCLYVVMPMRL